MLRSYQVVKIVFPSSLVVKSVHVAIFPISTSRELEIIMPTPSARLVKIEKIMMRRLRKWKYAWILSSCRVGTIFTTWKSRDHDIHEFGMNAALLLLNLLGLIGITRWRRWNVQHYRSICVLINYSSVHINMCIYIILQWITMWCVDDYIKPCWRVEA